MVSQKCEKLIQHEKKFLTDKIEEAKKLPITNHMVPSVFSAMTLDGNPYIGVNYQPEGTQIGHKFHFDHGVGIHKNNDAEVLWIA